jgi:beta-glucosidase
VHAPGHRDTARALAATHHLLLAHGLALDAMRTSGHEDNQLGVTLNLSPVRPSRDREADREAARRVDGQANRLYLDPVFRGEYPEDMMKHYRGESDFSFVRDGDLEKISAPVDFLGVNYYMRHMVREDDTGNNDVFSSVRARVVIPHNAERTAMGWPVEPHGLTEILVRLHEEYMSAPIYVTENGCAAHDYVDPEGEVKDEERTAFLEAHLRAAHEAMERGVDLKGYFVWSLLDNFEWAEGYSKRFGIVYIDYGTQRRIPKMSARWYSEVIRRNGLGGDEHYT